MPARLLPTVREFPPDWLALPVLPAAVFKPRHRISQILDESVIPFSTEIRFQQIKAAPVRFPFHQNVAVFHIVVLQLLHSSSQTDIQEQGNETDNQPCQKNKQFRA